MKNAAASPEEANVQDALEPFEPPDADVQVQTLIEALNKVMKKAEDLSEDDLIALKTEDPTSRIRQTYVLGYLKLLDFLRRKADNFGEREAQARIAMTFLRHHESSNLNLLQLGRTKSDEKMLEEVAALQAKLEQQARDNAAMLLAQASNVPSRPREGATEGAEQGPSAGTGTTGAFGTEPEPGSSLN